MDAQNNQLELQQEICKLKEDFIMQIDELKAERNRLLGILKDIMTRQARWCDNCLEDARQTTELMGKETTEIVERLGVICRD